MTHQTSLGSTTEPPASSDGAEPEWTRVAPGQPASIPTALAPDPSSGTAADGRARRRPWRDRVVRTWLALAVAAACLVVGLGAGVAVGRVLDTGSDRVPQRPTIGERQGPPPGYGRGGRDGFGGESDSSTNGSVTAAS